jgi:hypothetical protein
VKVLEYRFFTSEHSPQQTLQCRVNPFLWLLTREPARRLSSGYAPSSTSTARPRPLTRLQVFMTRRETLQCVHEPFGDAYYFGPERLAERYENDEQARKESGYSGSTYRTIFDSIARENSEVRTSQSSKLSASYPCLLDLASTTAHQSALRSTLQHLVVATRCCRVFSILLPRIDAILWLPCASNYRCYSLVLEKDLFTFLTITALDNRKAFANSS